LQNNTEKDSNIFESDKYPEFLQTGTDSHRSL